MGQHWIGIGHARCRPNPPVSWPYNRLSPPTTTEPARTIRWPYVDPMLGQRCRRWANIGSSWGQRIVSMPAVKPIFSTSILIHGIIKKRQYWEYFKLTMFKNVEIPQLKFILGLLFFANRLKPPYERKIILILSNINIVLTLHLKGCQNIIIKMIIILIY